jgi:hypothetical protein
MIADGDITLDFTKGITSKVSANIGHLGMDDFFASLTNVGLNFNFNPFDISLVGTGAIRIPKVGSELNEKGAAKFLRWIESFNLSDITLGSGKVYFGVNENDGFKLLTVVDVSTNPIPIVRSYGRMFFEMKLNTADGLYIDWGDGYQKLAVNREKGDVHGAYRKDGNHIQAVALNTFAVTSDVGRVFILVSSSGTVPASELISPTGKSYTATSTDSSVIKFDAANNAMTQWVLVNLELGDWKIKLTNPQASDEVSITALRKQVLFAINASVANRLLTVTWDPTGLDTADRAAILLDDNDNGFDGIPIGTVPATLGTYTYQLTDTLPRCTYYVAATLAANGSDIVTDYAPNQINTGKTILQPPTNIRAATNTSNGQTTISWTPSPDPNVATYIIYAETPTGDTVLSYRDRWETSMVIATENFSGWRIRIVAVDENELQGCPSEYQQVAVSVDEEDQVFAGRDQRMVVVPNPAANHATVYYRGENGDVSISVVNSIGQTVFSGMHHTVEGGYGTFDLDLGAANEGLYFVVARAAGNVVSVPIMVRR